MTLWNDMVVGICLLLLALLMWKEFRRPDRSRLVLRIAASVLAVAGLAGLILPFSFTRKTNTVQDKEAVFPSSVMRAGIVSVSWRQKLLPGEKLRIQGSLHNTTGKAVKLILRDGDTILDSAGAGNFAISTIPAQSGRAVYHLTALQYQGKDSGRRDTAQHGSGGDRGPVADTLEQEEIPVEVLPAKKLKILLLASSPDFENRFLVGWLSRSGHTVAMRTAISKEKYDKAYLNMPEISLDRLTPALLDKFDVLIADAEALRSISVPELSGLRRQVAEKGLGVIIRADSAGVGPGSAAGLGDATGLGSVAGLAVVKDSSQQLFVKESPGTQALVRDSLSRVLVSNGLYGAGRLLLTTRNDMYARLLAGDKKEYAAYWSLLLQKAARERDPAEEWQLVPALPRVGQPVRVLLQTNTAVIPQGQLGADGDEPAGDDSVTEPAAGATHTVYLRQHPLLPFRWEGRYWPERAGWQVGQTLRGDTCWWYAWPEHAWLNLDASVTDTTVTDTNGRKEAAQGAKVRILIPKAWFYTLLILSCIGLWIEKKI